MPSGAESTTKAQTEFLHEIVSGISHNDREFVRKFSSGSESLSYSQDKDGRDTDFVSIRGNLSIKVYRHSEVRQCCVQPVPHSQRARFATRVVNKRCCHLFKQVTVKNCEQPTTKNFPIKTNVEAAIKLIAAGKRFDPQSLIGAEEDSETELIDLAPSEESDHQSTPPRRTRRASTNSNVGGTGTQAQPQKRKSLRDASPLPDSPEPSSSSTQQQQKIDQLESKLDQLTSLISDLVIAKKQ